MTVALLASLCFLHLVCGSHNNEEFVEEGKSNLTFPPDFMFGVATAAFQIEGGWDADGRGPSMWDTHLHKHPNFTVDHQNGDIAADSYHKWREDLEMIRELGVEYYRMSISWTRILPHGTDHHVNKEGVRYYRRLFEELKKINVTVLVTLFHWDMPTLLMDLGGWANPKSVDYFVDYARVAFTLFGDIIKTWTTINEPHIHCYNGYGRKHFVPALNSHGVGEYLCSHYILLAHAKVYHLYDKEFRPHQKGKIGITLDSFYAEPKDATSFKDQEAAEMYLQFHLGLYAHPIYSEQGDYPNVVRQRVDEMSRSQGFRRSRLPVFTEEQVDLLRGSSDFFGLNHYTTFIMSYDKNHTFKTPSMDEDAGMKVEQNPNWPKPGADWLTVYPPGFRKLLNWITKNYGTEVPIIVTENGVCDWGGREDYTRVSYFNKYLYQLLLAIHKDKCNIQGYFAWTLMDDFEWSDGYATKFGLYEVDFDDPERTRAPKLSAYNYREIVRTRQVNFDYIRPTTHRPQI